MTKYNYITPRELEIFGYDRDGAKCVDLQIAIGLKTCTSVREVLEMLEDVRQHERDIIAMSQSKNINESMTDDEKERFY